MKKGDRIEIRTDSAEKKAFQEAASLAGIALSSWVRERLRSAAARDLEGAGKQIPFYQMRDDEDGQAGY